MAATLTFPKVDRTSFNFSWKFCVTFTISSSSASLNFTIEAAMNFIFPAHKFMLNLCECQKGKMQKLEIFGFFQAFTKFITSQASWFLSLQSGLILSEMFWFFQVSTNSCTSQKASWFPCLQLGLLLPQMFWFFQASTKSFTSQKASQYLCLQFGLLLNCFDYSESLQNPLHLKMPRGFFFSSFI